MNQPATTFTGFRPLTGLEDTQDVVDFIGDADFALLGEATHGTHDFYAFRANVTRKLIVESGVTAVVVEADWPDAYRVNRYVRHASDDADAVAALDDFTRFPTWMWRNPVMVEFIEWLRRYNDGLPAGRDQVGFYGMDLYALYASIRAVLSYLRKADPEAARRARERYSCFERYGEDPQAYAYVETFGLESCEGAVIEALLELQRRGAIVARDSEERDEHFFAEQNARLVKNAEEYYRTMFRGGTQSWNLRDQHMTETIQALHNHLSEDGRPAKIAVWAHNSHLGDARATQMGQRGELNVGQLMRERCPGRTRLIGFTTSHGTVTAASDWDEPVELKRVRPAMADSYERAFHESGVPRFFLPLHDATTRRTLGHPRLERAIGVIYRPDTERQSHYFQASLAAQFDGIVHLDHTTALRPLEVTPQWGSAEVPETYPTGV
jgi:erythromycin esterase-like protein